MSHSTFFNPAPAHARNVSTRLAAAYQAASIKAPSSFATALKRHLLTVPDVQQAAAGIAAEAYTADPDTDVHEFWDNAVDQVIRAQGADALKTALTSALDVQERSSGARQIERGMADLKPFADRHAAALAKAAKALPAGATALDPETVLAHDAGKHLTTARNALRSLALYAALPDTARHVKALGDLHRVLALVDPGKPVQEVASVFGKTMNAAKLDTTHALRKLAQDVKTNPDLALVDVARGAYPGVTLSPADSPATITDRAARARDAFTTRQPTPSEESLIHMR